MISPRRGVVGLVLLTAACAGSAPPPEARMATGASRAPYDAAPVNPGPITVALDLRAAREILALLGRTQFDANNAGRCFHVPLTRFCRRLAGG